MTRHFLRTLCRTLIGVVLFAQLAVSAHACPALSSAATMTPRMALPAVPDAGPIDAAMASAATVATGAMADSQATRCEDMTGPIDAGFANLCAEHCHQGQQSDHAPALSVPAAMRSALYITASAPEPMIAPRPAAAAPSALAAASPPLAILHCCFRL